MSTQRRDTDRGAGDAVERLWQTYADQIGIPGAEAAASSDALPRARDAKRQRRPVRRIGFGAGPLLLALAVSAIVVAAGAFWRHSPTVNGTSASRSATLASAPATEIERVVE